MKWSAWYGLLGGLLWTTGGLVGSDAVAGTPAMQQGAALLALASVVLGGALLGLARRWERAAGRSGRHGLRLGLAGLALFAAANLGRAALVPLSLTAPPFGLGLLLLDSGLVLLGSAALSGSAAVSWQALPLLLGLVGLFLPIGAGVAGVFGLAVWLVYGLGWCWLGAVQLLEPRVRVPAHARSRGR